MSIANGSEKCIPSFTEVCGSIFVHLLVSRHLLLQQAACIRYCRSERKDNIEMYLVPDLVSFLEKGDKSDLIFDSITTQTNSGDQLCVLESVVYFFGFLSYRDHLKQSILEFFL